MAQQSDINGKMRDVIVDCLIEVHYKSELMDETLSLMVKYYRKILNPPDSRTKETSIGWNYSHAFSLRTSC